MVYGVSYFFFETVVTNIYPFPGSPSFSHNTLTDNMWSCIILHWEKRSNKDLSQFSSSLQIHLPIPTFFFFLRGWNELLLFKNDTFIFPINFFLLSFSGLQSTYFYSPLLFCPFFSDLVYAPTSHFTNKQMNFPRPYFYILLFFCYCHTTLYHFSFYSWMSHRGNLHWLFYLSHLSIEFSCKYYSQNTVYELFLYLIWCFI
jgi:hypothetical protein